jgi:hypothetical protein
MDDTATIGGGEESSEKRAEILAELTRLQAEIRRRLLTLVEHPSVSEEFKNNTTVKEWVS